jgi:hypothetical protein
MSRTDAVSHVLPGNHEQSVPQYDGRMENAPPQIPYPASDDHSRATSESGYVSHTQAVSTPKSHEHAYETAIPRPESVGYNTPSVGNGLSRRAAEQDRAQAVPSSKNHDSDSQDSRPAGTGVTPRSTGSSYKNPQAPGFPQEQGASSIGSLPPRFTDEELFGPRYPRGPEEVVPAPASRKRSRDENDGNEGDVATNITKKTKPNPPARCCRCPTGYVDVMQVPAGRRTKRPRIRSCLP